MARLPLGLLALRAPGQAQKLRPEPDPALMPPLAGPPADLPPSLLAERLALWSRNTIRAATSAAMALASRAVGVLGAPFRGIRDGMRSAFSPVTAEGDRARGTSAFHGPPQKPTAPAGPAMSDGEVGDIIAAALAGLPDKGDHALPDDLAALSVLLSSPPPANDFQASDLVRDCFAPQGLAGLQSRALLGVAVHLTREFGLPTRLPLASDRAWRMLDPVVFEDEMAAQLAGIRAFISDWQKTQQTFLVLEFAEIELIEWLFECLHPARHSDLLFEVMNFKVLSNRRQGILRRIPHRVRKFVKDAGGGHEAILYAAGARAYLDRLVTTHGFTPIVETANLCLEEVDKVLEKLKPPAALPGPGGEGEALARITPVKMPASELADRAMAPAPPPAAQRPAAAPPPPTAMPVAPVAPQPLSSQPLPPRPQAAAPVPVVTSTPVAVPQTAPQATGNVRPATIRLLPKHIRAGAELTIPSRSAGRIPLGRMFTTGGTDSAPVPAISVKSAQTRPGRRPSTLPGPVNAVIPPSLPHLALPAPTTAAQTAPVQPTVAPAAPQPKAVTGRVNLAIPGRPVPAAPAQPTQGQPTQGQPTPVQARPAPVAPPAVAAPTATAVAPPPPVAAVPAALAENAAAPARGDNVTKLTMVQKRRLPITQALKRQAVMRVLRGEDAEAIAQSIGISRTKLDEWVDKFVAAGAGALTTSRKRKSEELTVDTLRTKLAEVLATAQLIEQVMEASLPRRPLLLAPPQEAASQAATPEAPPRRPRKKRG